MNRRQFLAAAVAAPMALRSASHAARADEAALPVSSPPSDIAWRCFEITTSVTLPDIAGPAQLWLPIMQTAGGYQTADDLRWQGTGHTERIHDARYGASMLRSTWVDGDPALRRLEVVQTVTTRDRVSAPLLPLTEAERRFWTAPTASMPVDGIVLVTASRITTGKTTPRERLRAIYDWVVDNTHRTSETLGCGRGDIQTMLTLGQLGGKCADINSLLVGLARAGGFPARDVYGIRVADSRLFPALGHSGDISKAQHCRAEVFLDEEGWFPLDAADVRKVMLEHKLALASPEVSALRNRLFGSWEMNWVGYNSGTDIQLPGLELAKPDFAFLMYPYAVTAAGPSPCLDPARFQYGITSREITT